MEFRFLQNMHKTRRPLQQSILAASLSAGVLLSGCGGNPSMTGSIPITPASSCTTSNATITHSAGAVNAAQIIFLDSARYPKAVCNDGSPGAYVLLPGSGAAASRWVISLQGGSECGDQASCAARAASDPQFVSSVPYRNLPPAAFQLNGIQSSSPNVNPDFYDATQVRAIYCSSDYWSGAKTGTGAFNANDVSTWNFQGHAILTAILADLKANHGLSNASEILFTGESAGGIGVYVNVNTVATLVPGTARFVAASDAGFVNGANNFSASGSPPDYTVPSPPAGGVQPGTVIALWNGSGDSVCASKATTPAAQVGCYSGAQLLGAGGTITLPMLVSEAQKDTVQLTKNGIPQADIDSGNFTVAESGYISYFASKMRSGLSNTNANVSIFSPDELLHTEANADMLFNTSYSFSNGTSTLRQVVGSWYKSPCTVQRDIAN